MKKNTKIILAILVVGGLVWLAFGFFGIQALFKDQEVKEEIPSSISELIADTNNDAAGAGGSESELLGKGTFQQGDSTYTISGSAYLSRIKGQLNLTFKDFKVTNGPDLYVYAVKTNSTENKVVKETVAEGNFISLGLLKGNIGDQNYMLDKDVDLGEYQVISIWCKRFGRNFGSVNLAKKPAQ